MDPIADLAAYLDRDETALRTTLSDHGAVQQLGMQRWQERFGSQPPEEVLPGELEAFYAEEDYYLYDLTEWHGLDPARAGYTRQMAAFAEELGLKSFLDFGAGIGQDGLVMAAAGLDVTAVDVPGSVADYAAWRAERHGLHIISIAPVVIEQNAQELRFDLASVIDVLGHVPDPLAAVRLLARTCRHVFYIEDFQLGTPWYPMHSTKPQRFDAWWTAHFRHVAGHFWSSRELSMKVKLEPSPSDFRSSTGGVLRHVEGLVQHLPPLGVQLVNDAAEADIVHTQAVNFPGRPPFAHVYTNHGVYPVGPPLPPNEAALQERIWQNLCSADEVISVAAWPTKRYETTLGIKANVIPNGVNAADWSDVPRGQSGLNPGYFLWAKGTTNGVCNPRPAQELARAMPDQPFVFTLIVPPAPPNVMAVGLLEFGRMKRVLADCAVLVATSLEVFSVQTLEAMALGKPILALWHGGDGGNNEAVVHKETGYIARDADDLVVGALYCLEHADRLGAAGRKRVEELYSWEHVASETFTVYLKALRKRQADAVRPKVSVIVPAYNCATTIGETLASVVNQSLDDFECIVVDDGSTDETASVIAPFAADERFQLIHQENAGVSAARNAGLDAARGQHMCFLDSDDGFPPTAIGAMSTVLDARHDVHIVYPDITAFGDVNGVWRMPEFSIDRLKDGNIMPYCSMFRGDLARRGIARYNIEHYLEDYEFWVNIAKRGFKALHIPQSLLNHRKRTGVGRSEQTKETHDACFLAVRRLHPDFWKPVVSVIIPCWNQAVYLPTAIESILAQTFLDWELIVVDDGSPDDVPAAMERFADDHRIKLLRQENRGLSGARNAGIAASVGKYFFTLDADDEAEPTFTIETKTAMENNPDISIVYTDFVHTIMNADGTRSIIKTHECPEFDLTLLLRQNIYINTVLQKREVWEAVGGYNSNMKYGWEDWNYAIDAAKHGFCAARLAKPLFRYLFKSREQGSMIQEMRDHRQEGLMQIRRNHAEMFEGRIPMGCCGGARLARGRTAATMTATPRVPRLGEMPLVKVQLVIDDPTPFSVRGAVTRTVYRNLSPAFPMRDMDPRDAQVLVQTDPRFTFAGVGSCQDPPG